MVALVFCAVTVDRVPTAEVALGSTPACTRPARQQARRHLRPVPRRGRFFALLNEHKPRGEQSFIDRFEHESFVV